VLEATIAGSLPKPAWLAAPETLWAPLRLPPETLLEGRGTSPRPIMGVRLVIPKSVLAQLPRGRPKAAAVAPR
jgi:hypothetical protein